MAVVYFLLSALFCIPAALWLYYTTGDAQNFFILLLPIFYMLIGYVVFALIAFLYNLAAKWCGGVEYTTTDSDTRG